jgi:hypothetical protein
MTSRPYSSHCEGAQCEGCRWSNCHCHCHRSGPVVAYRVTLLVLGAGQTAEHALIVKADSAAAAISEAIADYPAHFKVTAVSAAEERYVCTGESAAAEVVCLFETDDMSAALDHFEATDHDVVRRS